MDELGLDQVSPQDSFSVVIQLQRRCGHLAPGSAFLAPSFIPALIHPLMSASAHGPEQHRIPDAFICNSQ